MTARRSRRRRLAALAAAWTAAALASTGSAAAGTPPGGDDDGDDPVADFVEFAADEGYQLIDPVCTERADVATCHSLVLGGGTFVATRAADGTWTIVGGPDGVPDLGLDERDVLGNDDHPAESDEAPGAAVDRTADEAMQAFVRELDVVAFFTNLFSGDAALVREAIEMTAAGSPAEAYAQYQLHFVGGAIAAGLSVRPGDATNDDGIDGENGDAVTVCLSNTRCVTIDELVVADEQLITFSIDGVRIDERLGRPGRLVVAGSVEAALVSAYAPVTSDRLTAYVEVADNNSARVDLANAVYIDADGSTIPLDRDASPRALDGEIPKAIVVGLTFPGATPGGEIRFLVQPADGSTPLAVVLPVTPFDS